MRISEAADPLHFGYWGGTLTRYLWFLLGIVLTTLTISEVYLFGLRTLRSNHLSSQRVLWGKALTKGMGKLRWLSYLILLSYLLVVVHQYAIK